MILKFIFLVPVLLATFLSTHAVAENWVSIGKTEVAEVFLNDVMKKDKNNIVSLKQKIVFVEQQQHLSYPYQIIITGEAVDCTEQKVASTEYIYQDNSGRTIYSVEIPREQWEFSKENFENYSAVCNPEAKQSVSKIEVQSDTVNWIYLGKNNDGEFYTDTLSIRHRDGLIHVWEKAIFSGNQNEFMKYREGKLVSFALFDYVINCTAHTETWATAIFKDAGGAVIDYVEREPSKWILNEAAPGSLSDVLINTACTAASELPAKSAVAANSPPQLISSGSGFFVNTNGTLLTNQHVVDGCTTLKIRDSEKLVHDVALVATDTKNDLALLQTTESVTIPAATFRANNPAEAGEDVVALGYPLAGVLASEVNVSFGYVSATAGLADDTGKLQISAPVQPGNSGGPLLDQSGNLIGVVVAKLDAIKIAKAIGDIPQNVNFAVKGEVAQMFLKSHKVKFRTGTQAKKLKKTDITSRGRAFTVLVECYK